MVQGLSVISCNIHSAPNKESSILDHADPGLVPIIAGSGANLAEQAYQALRSAINVGTLEPGQRIPELELSSSFKISRTPIREALRRLQSDGLVVHAPGGGLAVAQHDLRAVAELYDVRERMEGTAAALAARNADRTEQSVLEAMLAGHKDFPDDPGLHARENKLLHDQIYRAAHNRFLLKSLQGLHDALALLGRTTFAAPGRIEEAWAEHAAIVAAIVRRDEAEAEAVARVHVRNAYEIRLAQLTQAVRSGARPS